VTSGGTDFTNFHENQLTRAYAWAGFMYRPK